MMVMAMTNNKKIPQKINAPFVHFLWMTTNSSALLNRPDCQAILLPLMPKKTCMAKMIKLGMAEKKILLASRLKLWFVADREFDITWMAKITKLQ